MKIALLAGLGLLATAIGLTLLGSPATVARTNRILHVKAAEPIAATQQAAGYCQPGEVLPHGTSAIRVWLDAAAGPRVRLVVLADEHTITSGERGSDWIGGSVTVPVKPLPHTVANVTVCVSFALRDETVIVQGHAARGASSAYTSERSLGGKMWIEYLRPGTRSWASLAPEIARRMGLGRAGGTWVVLVMLALLAALAVTCARLVREELS